MKKVYVIIYEELYSDGSYSSGISYAFDSFDKAKKMLQEIKEEERENYYSDWDLTEKEDEILFDIGDEYTKYEIIEMDVR